MTQVVPVRTRTSKCAIFSLILGIFGCVPGFSVLAVLLGVMGFLKGGGPVVRGRGMATVGIILGILFTLAWGGMGVAAWYGVEWATGIYRFGEAASKTDGQKLVASLVDGQGPVVETTKNLTMADVEKFREDVKKLGKPRGISMTEMMPEGLGAEMKLRITSRVEFEGGVKTVRVWVKTSENKAEGLRVDKLEIGD